MDRKKGIKLEGKWLCSPVCFERAILELATLQAHSSLAFPDKEHRVPIGLLMMDLGIIDEQQLKNALLTQKEEGGKMGEVLRRLGVVSEQQVTSALGLQWSCPVITLRNKIYLKAGAMVPFPVLEHFRMLPIHWKKDLGILHVAFSGKIDPSALYGIEKMLGCRTEPCIITESTLNSALEEVRLAPRVNEIIFDTATDTIEIARITRGYAVELAATQCKVRVCGSHLWIRLMGKRDGNILFKVGIQEATAVTES